MEILEGNLPVILYDRNEIPEDHPVLLIDLYECQVGFTQEDMCKLGEWVLRNLDD